MSAAWTAEQLGAIERREGGLLLAAAAGSGKTAVMVERLVRSVVEDGVRVDELLAITFTEKAAAELGTRLRAALRAAGRIQEARELDGAWVSTIHGFCARVLRAHPLQGGLDPRFAVLDQSAAERLAGEAFAAALDSWVLEPRGIPGAGPDAVALAAGYGLPRLRVAILGAHSELRARGAPERLAPAPAASIEPPVALGLLQAAAAELAAELGALAAPAAKVRGALAMLERCAQTAGDDPERALTLRLGNGAVALGTPAAERYRAAQAAHEQACVDARGRAAWPLLDALLREHAARYAELKRRRSALDFADLELGARELLRSRPEVRERYAARFRAVMVDEYQDTNPLQLEIVDLVAGERLFAVGDEQQSIYGFRGADVGGFRARRAALDGRGAVRTLTHNFRSRRAILDVVNVAFGERLGEGYAPLVPGRADAEGEPGEPPRVELLVTEYGGDWPPSPEGMVAPPWRIAESVLLARRVRALIDGGRPPGEIVLLVRATAALAPFERALAEHGVSTYVVGGRGYWEQPEVRDLIAHLAVLANPRDELSLYSVLASPLGAVSSDGLVLVSAAARAAGRSPWSVLREAFDPHPDSDSDPGAGPAPDQDPGAGEPLQLAFDLEGEGAPLAALGSADRARLQRLVPWLAAERREAARRPVAALLDRALARSGYDALLLRRAGGARQLANVRKLLRLARDHEADEGRDLRAFLDRAAERAGEGRVEARESEAPIEGEGLAAVRLMTIHRAKGLEFPVVCVADLGRRPPSEDAIVRLAPDGRVGLTLPSRSGKRLRAFAHVALGEERALAAEAEEARLLYVAATRACEHLVLSGSARLDPWPPARGRGAPIEWLAPAVVAQIAAHATAAGEGGVAQGVAEHDAGAGRVSVAWAINRAGGVAPAWSEGAGGAPGVASPPSPGGARPGAPQLEPVRASHPPDLAPPPPALPATVSSLSFTALEAYGRCGYRFALEHVLGLPAIADTTAGGAGRGGAARGAVVHDLLERLDFAHPVEPTLDEVATAALRAGVGLGRRERAEVAALAGAFSASPLCPRLARAPRVAREQRFAFLLSVPGRREPVLLAGALDALAWEDECALVVDYKTNRLSVRAPAQIVAEDYALQRLVYALALLRAGAAAVEVAYCFLERPGEVVSARYGPADRAALEDELTARAGELLAGDFRPSPRPRAELCGGCAARAGLCTHPPELTSRDL